jgi:hypothetical protein
MDERCNNSLSAYRASSNFHTELTMMPFVAAHLIYSASFGLDLQYILDDFVLSGNLCSSVPFKWRNHHLYLEEKQIGP